MISLIALFYLLIILFAIIGGTRGRTKEFIVVLAAVVGIFLNTILEQFLPGYPEALTTEPNVLFFIRSGILIFVVMLGYVTPSLPVITFAQVQINQLKNFFWGIAFGAINGYLIVGSIWYYLDQSQYPFSIITAPDTATPFGQAALSLIGRLPPVVLTPPGIYFAIAIAFVIILGAFI